MTELTHRLVGYDKLSGRVSVEHEIPDRAVAEARRIAQAPATAPDCLADRPLTQGQAAEIATLIRRPIDSERLDFVFEPSAAEAVPARRRKVARAS